MNTLLCIDNNYFLLVWVCFEHYDFYCEFHIGLEWVSSCISKSFKTKIDVLRYGVQSGLGSLQTSHLSQGFGRSQSYLCTCALLFFILHVYFFSLFSKSFELIRAVCDHWNSLLEVSFLSQLVVYSIILLILFISIRIRALFFYSLEIILPLPHIFSFAIGNICLIDLKKRHYLKVLLKLGSAFNIN